MQRLTDFMQMQGTAPEARVQYRSVRYFLFMLVLACLIPGLLGAMGLFAYEYRQERLQTERDTLQTARALRQAMDNHVLRTQALLQGLALSDALAAGNLERFRNQARDALSASGLGNQITLTERTGRQILSTAVDAGQSLPPHPVPALVDHLFNDTMPVVSNLYVSSVLHRPVVAVLVPVRKDGEITYALGMTILPLTLNAILDSQGLPPGWVATIFDGDGVVVARSREAARFVGQLPADRFYAQLMSDTEGSFSATMRDGVHVLATHTVSPATGWRVAISIPEQEIRAGIVTRMLLLAASVAGLFAVGLPLAWFFSKKIEGAFHGLIAPATALGDGKRITPPTSDIREAMALSHALGAASALLEERQAAMRRLLQFLREGEAKYRALFSYMSEAFVVGEPILDPKGKPVDLRMLEVNENFYRYTGIKEQIVDKALTEVVPTLERIWVERQSRVAQSGRSDTFEGYNQHTGRHFKAYCFSPSPGRFATLFIDVSEQKRLMAELQASETRLALALKAGSTAVWEMDVASGAMSPVNDLLYTMLGAAPEELRTARAWLRRVHDEDRPAIIAMMKEVIDGRRASFWGELRLRGKHGDWHWILSHGIASERDGRGRALRLVGTHTDITERKQAQEQIRQAALHDSLTGLPNRTLVFEFGTREVAAAARKHGKGAVLFIDLDRFKPINDLHGHDAGDQVLKEVSRRLLACTRSEDLVGRLGGDEFVVILPHLDGTMRHATVAVAEHIVQHLSQPYQVDDLTLTLSPSIGISLYPEHGDDISGLIHAADMAMYQAKQSGRATFRFYSPELDREAEALLLLEQRLKQALKSGGLELYYQPIVDIRSGRIISAEALLRLTDDASQPVGPDRFIPVAESAGLIGQMGEWVVRQACRQQRAWRNEGIDISVSFNVSPMQFRQRDFAETIGGIIRQYRVDPACLHVEVTESAIMDNLEQAIEVLNRIKALGVKVSLDDFGTGYSSLSRLSALPLDKLKVDQSFIRHIRSDHASRLVTDAIIALGTSLQLEVIGEGIETYDALRYLEEKGCSQAQGYLFSKPLPAAEFAAWCRQHG
ncbi:EAL domain-containing protein [Noviherbaspirillum galbum]|uniref:EAL domain-containing protein n=1 Tax=Noviherbaspirillum galbum TaxID=2709383 RepID=A0A6B3SLU6_9BURK|nr:EAL domain-containing protein [Noviherbaspirillum galbum]NEX59616.1 EAL domain-containing protein [Noviherbaspirillum galbum]